MWTVELDLSKGPNFSWPVAIVKDGWDTVARIPIPEHASNDLQDARLWVRQALVAAAGLGMGVPEHARIEAPDRPAAFFAAVSDLYMGSANWPEKLPGFFRIQILRGAA